MSQGKAGGCAVVTWGAGVNPWPFVMGSALAEIETAHCPGDSDDTVGRAERGQ